MKRWALISGSKGTGKSTAAARVAMALSERGVFVAGFFQQAIEEDGERVGYRVRRLNHTDEVVVARKGTPRGPSETAFCSFVFDLDAFRAARRWMSEDAGSAQVIIIDEVSKLEVAGNGHHDAIAAALATASIVVLAVRADQLFYVVERFGLGEPVASFETGAGGEVGAFVDALSGVLSLGVERVEPLGREPEPR